MIATLYTHFNTNLSGRSWAIYMNKLPEVFQEKIERYKRWQDKQARLFGKLLLIESLKTYGYSTDCLNNIALDQGHNFIGWPYTYSAVVVERRRVVIG